MADLCSSNADIPVVVPGVVLPGSSRGPLSELDPDGADRVLGRAGES